MPVLACQEKITPKSVLRHRPIGEQTFVPSDKPGSATLPTRAITPRASRLRGTQSKSALEIEEQVVEWKRQTTGEATPAQPRLRSIVANILSPLPYTRLAKHWALRQAHPLVYLGLGMIAMVLLWALLSPLVGWVSMLSDDLRYGRPRTFQTDAWVGHNEQSGKPSHFIAMNLHGHLQIIEIAGGDAATTRILSGPVFYGDASDLAPVTLQFADVNGDHTPDMIVRFEG